jgi:hypothetical protein
LDSHGEVWDVFYLPLLDSVVWLVDRVVIIIVIGIIMLLMVREHVDSGGGGIVRLRLMLVQSLIELQKGTIAFAFFV